MPHVKEECVRHLMVLFVPSLLRRKSVEVNKKKGRHRTGCPLIKPNGISKVLYITYEQVMPLAAGELH